MPIATLQFFLSNETFHGKEPTLKPAYKFDVANLVDQRSVHFASPPQIREVRKLTEIVAYVIVGVCTTLQAGLLFNVLKHRNNSIMKLSQVYFLVTLQIAGIAATVSTILYNPRSDTYCRLRGPFTMIPLQLMLAIMIGRLHRILVIMAPLLTWRKEKTKKLLNVDLKRWSHTFMSSINILPQGMAHLPKVPSIPYANDAIKRANSLVRGVSENGKTVMQKGYRSFCVCWHGRRSSGGIKQQYDAAQLNALIVAVTFPMVVIEAVGLIFFDPVRTLHMNDDNSVGTCGVIIRGPLRGIRLSHPANCRLFYREI